MGDFQYTIKALKEIVVRVIEEIPKIIGAMCSMIVCMLASAGIGKIIVEHTSIGGVLAKAVCINVDRKVYNFEDYMLVGSIVIMTVIIIGIILFTLYEELVRYGKRM